MKVVQPIRNVEKIDRIKKLLRRQSARNYIIFILGLYTGLRVSDFSRLKVKDFRGKEHLVIIERKTGKTKRLIINQELKREVLVYSEEMEDDDYLLRSREGENKPLSRSMIYNILAGVAKQVGLSEIGTHTLRKTFGYHFYRQTKDVALLQELFNHSSPAITLKYIGINQDIMDKAVKRFKL